MLPRPLPAGVYAPLVLLAVTACACDAQVDPTRPATITPTPYVRSGLTPALVTRVDIDGQEYRVRYIGIDTPETVDPRRPVGCFGREASERNRQLVEGQTVGLEKDVSETDDFNRLLRYVWAGDVMVNAALVEGGFALASTYPPDVRYAELFSSLQAKARESQSGLWGAACEGTATSP
jgi:endonuclease YncB( thermonuclease family)